MRQHQPHGGGSWLQADGLDGASRRLVKGLLVALRRTRPLQIGVGKGQLGPQVATDEGGACAPLRLTATRRQPLPLPDWRAAS